MTTTADNMGVTVLQPERHSLTSVHLAPTIGLRSTLHFDTQPDSSERGWVDLKITDPEAVGSYSICLTVSQLRQLALLCNVWAEKIDYQDTITTTTGDAR